MENLCWGPYTNREEDNANKNKADKNKADKNKADKDKDEKDKDKEDIKGNKNEDEEASACYKMEALH